MDYSVILCLCVIFSAFVNISIVTAIDNNLLAIEPNDEVKVFKDRETIHYTCMINIAPEGHSLFWYHDLDALHQPDLIARNDFPLDLDRRKLELNFVVFKEFNMTEVFCRYRVFDFTLGKFLTLGEKKILLLLEDADSNRNNVINNRSNTSNTNKNNGNSSQGALNSKTDLKDSTILIVSSIIGSTIFLVVSILLITCVYYQRRKRLIEGQLLENHYEHVYEEISESPSFDITRKLPSRPDSVKTETPCEKNNLNVPGETIRYATIQQKTASGVNPNIHVIPNNNIYN